MNVNIKTVDTPDAIETEHPAIAALRRTAEEVELKVMNFTLADAIREGSNVTTQKFGSWIDSGTSCTLGAAFLSAKARGFIK